VPAVVLLELMQQQLQAHCHHENSPNRHITGIKKLKFIGLVAPEQALEFQWQIKSDEQTSVTVTCEKIIVAKGSILTRLEP
jgi:3-hydroxymyristoyl/3-hydroxydecanoyl-(acyl carrier protein) dehydratase